MTNKYTSADRELVSKILTGDRHAFGMLVEQTERLVAQLIFRIIPNPADRKDIAQDVYLKVYASLPKFRFQSKLSTYIGQVTYNTCLHYLEKKRLVLLHGFAVNNDADTDTELEQLMLKAWPATGNEAEARLFTKDLEKILHAALLELPVLYQTIIGLYHQQELPLSEIAEITSLPVGTVKSYLFRARKGLKDILLKNYKKEEL